MAGHGEEYDEDDPPPPLDLRAMTLYDLAVIALLNGPNAKAAARELARRGYRAEPSKPS